MRKEERYKGILNWFQQHVPVAETELHYENPFQLLVAVILSAQCTDKRVNMVTPALFHDFPEAETMARNTMETTAITAVRMEPLDMPTLSMMGPITSLPTIPAPLNTAITGA